MDEQPPIFYLVAGNNGAGKTTFIDQVLKGLAELVNTDIIAAARGKGDIDAGREALKKINQFIKTGQSFIYETTLSGKTPENLVTKAKNKGFEVNFVYLGLNAPEMYQERVKERVKEGGHDVPAGVIKRRYEKSLKNAETMIKKVDTSTFFDNTRPERDLLFIQNGRKRFQYVEKLPAWVKGFRKCGSSI